MNIKRMIAMQRNFAEIEKFLAAARADSLTEIKDTDLTAERGEDVWLLTQKNEEGRHYDLLGSMDSWCDFFEGLAKYYKVEYDDLALRKLISKLRLDQQIEPYMISDAERVVDIQRKLHMQAEPRVYEMVRQSVFEKIGVAA